MNKRNCRILLTGGGSGGPTVPLLGLAQTLLDREELRCEFLFLGGGKGPEQRMVKEYEIPFRIIPSGKLRRYWDWKNLIDPFFVLAGFFAGVRHLISFRPDAVVSAGSYVSVPVAWACGLFRIPHLILQMDFLPGLANRLMSPFSRAVACYFEDSLETFKGRVRRKIIGPVVRKEILEADPSRAEKRFNLDPELPLLTVTGGGQGARELNLAVENLLEVWLGHWQVVHLTGKNSSVKDIRHPHYHPVEFVEKGMGDLLARSELVITRAGMGMLGELSVLARDALVIPLPGTHQEENARVLERKGAILTLDQQSFASADHEVWRCLMEKHQPGRLGKLLHQTWTGPGNQELADLVLHCARIRESK